MNRAINFCAGPCTLPLSVLEEAQAEFVDFAGSGMSLLEMSHRSEEYDAVHQDALAATRSVFGVPDDFDVLFVQGGASLQFAMVPLNLLRPGESGAYVSSGAWGAKALADAAHHGDVYAAWDGAGESHTTMPADEDLTLRPATRFLHITSNETIHGVRFAEFPAVAVPLVGDMSSDFMSRPIPWDRFDVVYGGVQKNLAPAGMAVVFARRGIDTNRALASYLRWDVHAAKDSLYNTPPMFTIWMMGKMLRWIEAQGGIEAMDKAAHTRAEMVYDAIDRSDGFYQNPVAREHRSLMNVVFRLPDPAAEERFIEEAERRAMRNLKGHRSVGGVRASLYNAMPIEGVERLVSLMAEFRA